MDTKNDVFFNVSPFNMASFWVSMLVFGGVHNLLQNLGPAKTLQKPVDNEGKKMGSRIIKIGICILCICLSSQGLGNP